MLELQSSPISKFFALCSVGVSLLHYLQVVDAYQLYYNKDLIFQHHEYWRLFTSLFHHGPLGFNALIHILSFLQYATSSESLFFSGRPADFIIFSLFGSAAMWIFAAFTPIIFLGHIFTSYFTYYWCKRSPDNRVFLMNIPIGINGPYVPLLFLGISILNTSLKQALPNLIGFGTAHIYFFLHDVINTKFNTRLFYAPDSINKALSSVFQ